MDNKEFIWTDELVALFAQRCKAQTMEDFKRQQKVKKEVCFITDAGNEIFDGDRYWYVDSIFDISNCTAYKDVLYNKFESRTFSTKEAAETYVLLNKPLLSVDDIMRNEIELGTIYYDVLKDLAQKKLNK